MTLCGRSRFAGWSVGHNVKPRTSRRGDLSAGSVDVSAAGVVAKCDGLAPLASLRFYSSIPNALRISSAAAAALMVPSTTSRSRSLILLMTSGCRRTAARTP